MGNSPHLAVLIRRELKTDTNRRFLQAMPSFRTESDLPGHLSDLLRELDRAQSAKR